MGIRPPALIPAALGLLGLLAGCAGPALAPPATPTARPPTALPAETAAEPALPLQLQPARLAPEPSDPAAGPTPAGLFLPSLLVSPAPPVLIIPDLDLSESIVPVPVTDGIWEISALGPAVGWLATTGAAPGAALAPALVGHVSLENGTRGPFGYLWRLKLAADVFYEWQGQRYHYQVDDKRTVAPEAVEALYVPDGRRLLLVTCDGWDLTRWRYTERLLVSAVLVDVETLTP